MSTLMLINKARMNLLMIAILAIPNHSLIAKPRGRSAIFHSGIYTTFAFGVSMGIRRGIKINATKQQKHHGA